ncbi:ATP-binding protein [Pontibacter sp. SGAir0037]|uniref:ATP-binding protein n=1 Tax=Pontibacter sp. SGAir0037 TaxID=2571030 RepID=UPI0010CCFE51|nr:ATP-binding protein [Pontibacter sp. SGAir0037]QCR22086.1 two-component sensor histidine kinase [Pontibacter sp. SGAir0037]
MKIRHRLTLLFTAIMGAILLAFAFAIYFSYASNREEEFYRQLRQQAITKANLLFDAQVDPEILQTIYRNTRNSHYQEEVAIYDTGFNLLYHDAVDLDFVKETADMMAEIRQKQEIQFKQEGLQVVGFLFSYQGKNYIITAAAYDENGYTKLWNLRLSLVVALVVGIIIIFLTGRFFSRQALQPVAAMVDKAGRITATNIDLRLPEGNGKDEISELAITFNQMLDRLEGSLESQRHFVSNVSHELRTPLAAIIAELELARSQKRTSEAYESAIDNALSDARKLTRLSTGMLDLAKASYDQAAIKFKEVRLDELLLDARLQVLRANPDYHIHIAFDTAFEDDNDIAILGNEYLLRTAFSNLMENGCKFSPARQSDITIGFDAVQTHICFKDQGIGIPQEEQQQVFEAFYRGSNRSYAEGNGIGLSLTHKIVKLHKGEISLVSEPGLGTTFTLSFRHL